jgi:hypothetical protein
MMKKLLCLFLVTFALSLFVPATEAAVLKAKPTLVKAGKKNKKHKKHRKHGKHNKKASKNKA